MAIASGTRMNPLSAIENGGRATWFSARATPASARKAWIGGHLEPRGTLELDAGAIRAVVAGRSLLPAGVRNIEMEATQFAAFTRRVGVRAAILCVALLNRLDGDQVLTPVETLMEWDTRPGEVALNYIKSELRK